MRYQGAVTLSKEEQLRYSVLEKFRAGHYSRSEAAQKLNLSERQISRLAKKVREHGFFGVIHGNIGRESWNKTSEGKIKEYVDLYEKRYGKFNYSHALEMMAMHEEMKDLSYTVFRKACRKRGIGKVKRRKTSKAKVARERYAEEGYMWQMDGSPEVWDGKDSSCLIGLIDDATNKIPNATLYPSETTWGCMNVVRQAVERHGRPEFILTDCAGWSPKTQGKRAHFSQFERACRELDITVIATPSPESKGRIERLNRTFQDRLIPELDLYGITGNTDCNRYLDQVFIPSMNEKYSVQARESTTRYRAVESHHDLNEIFCLKFDRKVNRDHTVSYENQRYKINPGLGQNFKGKEVKIHEYEDKTISIFYGGKKLNSQKMPLPRRNYRNCA